jgi:peptidoglycan/xylan/chitin deacetylase (PgdA/CDA1 family)
LLLAALVLVFIIVVTSDGGARTGSDGAIPSGIALAAHETPMVKPPGAKAPTRKRPTVSPSPRHPSDQASRKQRFRQGDEPPAKRGGTVYLTFDDGPSQYTPAIDTRDWSRPGTQRIVQAATGPSVRAGSIVLLHDGGGDRSETVAALPHIIAALQHQGYAVRRIPGC